MITAIRNHAQSWLIKVLLGLISITFVVSFSIGRFTADRLVLVRVGPNEISVNEFNREYEQELDALRQRFGENADAMALQFNLRKQVFDRLVNRQLVLNAAREQGQVVTDEEVSAAITSQPNFRIDDRFDHATYLSVLAQNRLTPEGFEESTRRDLQAEKYQRNLLAGLVVGKGEVDQRYRIENEKVVVEAFQMAPEAFKGKVASDAEAEQAYYDANKRDFMQPDRFKLRYFVLSLAQVEANVKLKERAIQRYYERYQDERFTTPMQVRASHILKKLPKGALAEQETKARAELTEVLKKAKQGADFAALARKHSEDVSKDKGGDLGYFVLEDMLPEFAEAAFALERGEMSGIVRTDFGLHVIKVTGVKPGVTKSLQDARPEIEKTLRNLRAERKLNLEAERLPRRIAKEGIEAVAEGWKLEPVTSGWIDATGVLKKLGSTRGLYGQLRNRSTGESGVWRRNPLQGHVFYRILQKKDAFQRPLDDVRKQVTEKVLAARMADAAVEEAKAAFKQLTTYKAFKAEARKRGLKIVTSEFTSVDTSIPEVGLNREFLSAAFRLTADEPIGLSINGKTAHLMYLKKRHIPNANNEKDIREQITARIEAEWAQYFLQTELDRLKAETEIEVVTPELVSSL